MRNRIQKGSSPDAREAFLEILVLFSEASEIIALDPCLPEELLPANWLGLEVQDLIHEYFHYALWARTGRPIRIPARPSRWLASSRTEKNLGEKAWKRNTPTATSVWQPAEWKWRWRITGLSPCEGTRTIQ